MSARGEWILLATVSTVAMTGCGGGGGGSNSGVTPAPTPGAAATVTITPYAPEGMAPSIGISRTVGETFAQDVKGTITSKNLAAGEIVYLRVQDKGDTLLMPETMPVSPNGPFTVTLRPKRELLPGEYVDTFELTACRDPRCDAVYGAPVGVRYRVSISQLGDWQGIQRDHRHDGFVPTNIDASRLAVLWEWRPPLTSPAGGGIFVTRPATTPDAVAVLSGTYTTGGPQDDIALHVVDEFTGQPRWSWPIPDGVYAQAPVTAMSALNTRQVILQTLNHSSLVTSFNAQTGVVNYSAEVGAPISTRTLAPTSFALWTYYYAGPNGSEIHSIDNTTGALRWSRQRPGLQSGTPTVRNAGVYHRSSVLYQNGRTIEVLDTETGSFRGTITDPGSDGADSPFMRPVMAIGSRDNVIAVSYNGAAGASPLSSFNIDGLNWEWSTVHSYRSFAVSDLAVYSYREGSAVPTLDAIDERNGQLLWSWMPPVADAQVRTVGNLMLTQNLVFISTEGADGHGFVWAIDRATRQAVWRHAGGGYVVMSGSQTLYVLTGPGNGQPSNMLRAFRMK